ncbi:MAG TPA: aminotransferase class IV [Solirubrobacteraceae bacterium]|nr:aminotransferase class IV [Solirubrobacteraceae bacterium]
MSAEPRRGDPGLGVFETVRVHDGRIQAADAHLARLRRSLRTLYGLDLPPALGAELGARAARLPGPHRLRIDAIPAHGGLDTGITASPLPDGPPDPVPAAIVTVPGGLGPHKLRDRALLATLSAPGLTPLIADRDGTVLEAAWGNLWLREDDRLITPPADGRLLPGVTRARLLRATARDGLGLGLTALEEPVSRARLKAADAIFITSALRLAVAAAVGAAPASEPAWLIDVRVRLSREP